MANKIFYWSATGNSLAFARALAAGIGETQVISIPKVIGSADAVRADGAERVGLVFPVFAWGPPRIVKDFIKQLRVSSRQYVFAVATCGGVPGNTLRTIDALLRRQGGHLDAGFAVREPSYGSSDEPAPIRMVKRAAGGVRPGLSSERLSEIIKAIRDLRKQRPEVSRWAAGFLGDLFHGMSDKMTKTADRGYSVDGRCVGCGTCARVCPRANIKLVDGRPKWQGDCQLCQACLQWCPQQAIQMGEATKTMPRTHRSGITLDDMLTR